MGTDIDLDLQKAVLEAINDLDSEHELPASEQSKIARDAVAEDRVTDGEWIYQRMQESKADYRRKRNMAKVRGYAPFTSLSKRVYTKLVETFGMEMMDLMKTYLKDPEDIYTKWCYRFLATIDLIGRDVCFEHRDELYSFVIKHPKWESERESVMDRFNEWIQEGRPEQVQQAAPAEETEAESGQPQLDAEQEEVQANESPKLEEENVKVASEENPASETAEQA